MKGALVFSAAAVLQKPVIAIRRHIYRNRKMPGSFVTVNGSRIYYEQKGSGTPVLYIHGNTGSHEWFRYVMDLPGYRTIAPDIVNFGHSDHIGVSDIDVYADYIKVFMDLTGLDDILVVGHSLGGAVAMSVAVRYPDKIRKLLLVDPSPVSGLKTPEEYYPVIERYKKSTAMLKRALAAVIPSCRDPEVLNILLNEAMLMNEISYTGNARALAKADFRDKAGVFNKPVRVVSGGLDSLITPQMAEETASFFNGDSVVVEHVGHSLMIEDPELFKEILLGFDSEK